MIYVIGPTCIVATDRSCAEACLAGCILGEDDGVVLFIAWVGGT